MIQGDQVIQICHVTQIFLAILAALEDLAILAILAALEDLAILTFHVSQIFLAAQSILWGLRVLTGQ